MPSSFAKLEPEQVQELARRVRARLVERRREPSDPQVVLAELLLVGEHVVHPVHQVVGQHHVIDVRRALVVEVPERLVDVVKEIRAG
jgi:hypothetical protein